MGVLLSKTAQQFLHEQVYAHIATVMRDGSPQVTPLWVETDGTDILINTATGRLKTRNMQRDARVALSIMGMESAYRGLWVRGRVKEIKPDNELIDALSLKYTGNPDYQGHRDGETRVTVRIEPEHIAQRGLDLREINAGR